MIGLVLQVLPAVFPTRWPFVLFERLEFDIATWIFHNLRHQLMNPTVRCLSWSERDFNLYESNIIQ